MQPQIKLGRIFGIQVGLHYTWFIIALLIVLSLAAHFEGINPQWGTGVIWTAAIVTGVLFFGAIVLHELAHALVARSRNLPVRAITLFALGGVAQIEKEAADPKTEFWMGIAGPLMSVLIGVVCLGVVWAHGWSSMDTPDSPVLAVLAWLGYINFLLAVFNMIPGFPLDGGRVLRAILWWTTGSQERATRTAARVGQGVAFFFILFGLWRFFTGWGFGGLWLALIGWFLLDAARASYAQVEIIAGLRGVRVGDIMEPACDTVDRRINLQQFAEEYVWRTGRRCFLVRDNGRVAGLVTPHEVKAVDRSRWPFTPIEAVMRPLERVRTVTPDTPVIDALQTMSREDINQVPVVSNGRLEGLLSRGQILQVLQAREELDM